MKYDMCGAASCSAPSKPPPACNCCLNLTVVVPAVENMPKGRQPPWRHRHLAVSGQTIEILNTDAEGPPHPLRRSRPRRNVSSRKRSSTSPLTGACVVAPARRQRPRQQGRPIAWPARSRRRSPRPRMAPALWDDYQKLCSRVPLPTWPTSADGTAGHHGRLLPVAAPRNTTGRTSTSPARPGNRAATRAPPAGLCPPDPLPAAAGGAPTEGRRFVTQIFFLPRRQGDKLAAACLAPRPGASASRSWSLRPVAAVADGLDRLCCGPSRNGFHPHCPGRFPTRRRNPIPIADQLDNPPQDERLMNLGLEVCPIFPLPEPHRSRRRGSRRSAAARDRVRFYKDRGLRHPVGISTWRANRVDEVDGIPACAWCWPAPTLLMHRRQPTGAGEADDLPVLTGNRVDGIRSSPKPSPARPWAGLRCRPAQPPGGRTGSPPRSRLAAELPARRSRLNATVAG